MTEKPQEKLEVSKNVIEQLNAMARNDKTSNAYGPQSPGPTPAPHNQRDEG